MIGVVVVHYEDPTGLDRVLTALADSGEDVHVVVADDGSGVPPTLGERPYPASLVSQEDRGFRAAAARNLGARTLLEHTRPDALLFLDGDTIPGPGYVRAMADAVRRAAAAAPHRRTLVVGRRRYADLTGLSAAEVQSFVASPLPARILRDVDWLDEGYAATDHLRNADDRSYRFVISAVLATTPDLFETTGGFDESFVGYGGEDWDLAWRAWLAGADLVHEPRAVAWHDGPDAAGRDEAARASGADRASLRAREIAETLRVARVVTEPGARDPGLVWDVPDITVEFDDAGLDPADVLLTCADLVRGSDARVWLTEGAVVRDGLWPTADPRVGVGPVPAWVRARARYRVHVTRAVRLTEPLSALCGRAPLRSPGIDVVHARAAERGEPAPPITQDPAVRAPRADADLEAEWGWRDPESLPVATTQDRPTAETDEEQTP